MRNPELPAGGGILFLILLKASVVGGIFFEISLFSSSLGRLKRVRKATRRDASV